MKSKFGIVAIALLILLVVVGCGSKGANTAIPSTDSKSATNSKDTSLPKNFKIGALWSTTAIPPVRIILTTIEGDVKAAGGELVNLDAQFDPFNQVTQAKNLISQKADAVFLNVIDPAGIIPSLKNFQDAGIPLIVGTLPVTKEGEKYITSFVGTDNIAIGKLAGELLVDALGSEGGDIAIIEGDPGVVTIERTQGIKSALGKNINVVDVQTSTGWDRAKSLSIMQDFLSKYPKLKGVVVHNDDMAIGAVQAIKQAGKQGAIKVIGFNGTKEAVAAIKTDEMFGTVTEDLAWTAHKQVEVALAAIQKKPVEKIYLTPIGKLTKANLDSWTPAF